MFAATMATVLGSVILIGVVEPYFLIAFVFVIGLYWTAAQVDAPLFCEYWLCVDTILCSFIARVHGKSNDVVSTCEVDLLLCGG